MQKGQGWHEMELNLYKHSLFCSWSLDFEGFHIHPTSLFSKLLESQPLAEILMHSLNLWLTSN